MNKFTFVLFTTVSIIFTAVLTGCSDRDTENKPASPEATQQASETATPALIKSDEGSVDAQMDHDNPEPGQMAGGHGETNAHEEQEGMAHEHGEHAGMQGMSHWNAPAMAATLVNPVAADDVSVKRGSSLYAMNCIACHGATGRGDGPVSATLDPKPADLVVMAPMHPGGDFFWKIENGRGVMPAWKDTLDENQIWDLVNYIKSLGEDGSPDPDGDVSDGHDHAH